MPIARQSRTFGEVLNKEAEWFSSMKEDKSDESIVKVNVPSPWGELKDLEMRVIAVERALEAILRRLEASGQTKDEAGWFGRPE